MQTWVNGKAVVKNTATGYSLKNTRDSANGVHAIDDQVRPIDGEVRSINGALNRVATALTNATR